MIVQYKGCEINVYRGESITGEEHIFYYVFDEKTGLEITSGYAIDGDTIGTHLESLKETVDDYIENPEDYE